MKWNVEKAALYLKSKEFFELRNRLNFFTLSIKVVW